MTTLAFDVVIPARDAEHHLSAAIESARRAGAQAVIVVDDGSVDGTAAVAKAMGCTVVQTGGVGAARARRRGLLSVSAPIVVYLDADDELIASGIVASLSLLEMQEEAVGVLGATVLDGGAGGRRVMVPPREVVAFDTLVARGHAPGPPGAFVWRVEHDAAPVLATVEHMDPRYAEDYELVLRAALAGAILTHSLPVIRYRTGAGKSASAPLQSVRDAELLRARYASVAGVAYRPRADRTLKALVHWRRATEPAAGRSIVDRWLAGVTALAVSPGIVISRVRSRATRRE